MKTLNVLLYGQHVADLTQTRGGAHELVYLTEDPPAPVSLSMPPQQAKHTSRQVNPFLEGLLPDRADVRAAMGERYGVSGNNSFALLSHVGEDCAGAVQFVHPARREEVLGGKGELHPASEQAIGDRLRDLRNDDSISWVATQEHWSLAGAQAKFAVRKEGGDYFSPTGAEPTSHIIKPGVVGFRDQALNEHICMTALRKIGIAAAVTEFRQFDGQDALVVERYDRARDEERSLFRIHQEDMCQALSYFPRKKYESQGGPRAADVIQLLRRSSDNPAQSVDRFIDGLICNFLLGAPDAHAKNYGVMLAGQTVEVTPLYDVASGLPYDSETQPGLRTAAMKIGRENRFSRIAPRHWERLAREAALDHNKISRRVYELSQRIPSAVEAAVAEESPVAEELGGRFVPAVKHHCAVVRNQYSEFVA